MDKVESVSSTHNSESEPQELQASLSLIFASEDENRTYAVGLRRGRFHWQTGKAFRSIRICGAWRGVLPLLLEFVGPPHDPPSLPSDDHQKRVHLVATSQRRK